MPFSNSPRSLQRPESGKIKLLNRSHNVVVILTFHVDQQQKMKQATFLAVGRSILYRQEFLRRTGHSMLRDWNMDKVHEVGWCMASALTAMQRASKSSWFLACSSCFPVWPFAELCYVAASVILCACSALRRGIVRKNPKHTVAWDRGG